MTWCGLELLTSLAVRMSRVISERLPREPGIDADAVTADSRPGFENVDARVTIGEGDDFPGIDIDFSLRMESSLAKAMLTSP